MSEREPNEKMRRLANVIKGDSGPITAGDADLENLYEGGLEPIAITGMACRFPGGANSPESYWKMLKEGVDAITEVPPERWDAAAFYDPDPSKPGKTTSRWGGFVDQPVEDFDARFFGIAPREAAHVDPMQRWLLETSWEALEDAGQAVDQLAGSSTGVFVGVFTEDVKLFQLSEANRELIDGYSATGTAMTLAANRISYQFDLRGPSVAMDTACSSSLIAVHYACQSLWSGDCDLALAGGVNVMFRPEYLIAESKAGMLSPDGRSRAFDSRANGYVRGEGAGMVVLKPLSAALADGDPIHALIRATAANQDGRTNGITVPNGEAQEALVKEACRRAGISPGQLSYVEAHGTGTPVGDPIEANALANALAEGRPEGERCIIASVKTNIGHLEAAAGVAGLIKAALCLEHGEVPPHLHLEKPNPKIDLERLCIEIPAAGARLPDDGRPLYAGVNSFGFGGSSAHVILSEAPRRERGEELVAAAGSGTEDEAPAAQLVPLSAQSPEALRALAEGVRALAEEEGAPALVDLAHTAGVRRSHLEERLAVVARDTRELAEKLGDYLSGEQTAGVTAGQRRAERPEVAFVFSGMGPQWYAMGRQLMEEEPLFYATLLKCDRLLREAGAEWSLIQELSRDEEGSRMHETQIAQPANCALQIALTELWHSWGIEAGAIVGHSAGEAAAFYRAGVYDLETAMRVIYQRSRLQHRATGKGKLAAVGLPLDEARELIAGREDRLSIAAINSHRSVTIAGDEPALEELAAELEAREVFCRILRVEVPYHSHFMDPIEGELRAALSDVECRTPRVPLYSTVTGTRIEDTDTGADYWWRNTRHSVYFAKAIDAMIDDGYRVFVEVGPHPVLAGSITEALAERGAEGVIVPSLRRKEDEAATLLGSLGVLYTLGCAVDWRALTPEGRHVALPTYPWQRERHWEESEASVADRFGLAPRAAGGQRAGEAGPPRVVHPLLGRRLGLPHPIWEGRVERRSAPWLDDHQVQGTTVYPGAAFVEMALAAGAEVAGEGIDLELEGVEFRKALFVAEDAAPSLQVSLDPRELSFEVSSPPESGGGAWTCHVAGRLRPALGAAAAPPEDVESLADRIRRELDRETCYAAFGAMGLEYGPCFQGVGRIWKEGDESLARPRFEPAVEAELGRYRLHPALLDACFQVLIATAVDDPLSAEAAGTYLPVRIERLRWHARGVGSDQNGQSAAPAWIHARLERFSDNELVGSIRLLDTEGRALMSAEGVRAESLEAKGSSAEQPLEELFYELEWHSAEAPESREDGARSRDPWLVFAGGAAESAALVRALEARGERCLVVSAGDGFRRTEEGFVVDPAESGHYRRLLAEAAEAAGEPCRAIAHLWSLETPADGLDLAALEAAQELTCLSLMHLVQAIDAAELREPPRLWVATRGAQSIGERSEPVAVAQAGLWGMALTMGYQEHPELWGSIVDLPRSDDDEAVSDLARRLLAEIDAERPEPQVVLRGDGRYLPRLAHRREWAGDALPPRFRPDVSYLVTGGFGGLGREVARWMVDRGARRLVLMGRSPLAPRAEWAEIEDPGQRSRIAFVRELEARGAVVHAASVDSADPEALEAFLDAYAADGWPPIRGVVHLAGVSEPELLLQTDTEAFMRTLRPKLAAWNLHRALADEPLECFVLFSSVAAFGFTFGQCSYAAGNAFLDGVAHARRAAGLPATSVNWGAWAEAGMASRPEVFRDLVQRGFVPMSMPTALEALGRVLTRPAAQVTVLGADWPRFGERNFPLPEPPALIAEPMAEVGDAAPEEQAPEAESFLDRLRAAEAAEREPLLEDHLRSIAARVLRLKQEALEADRSLGALGLDSMMAVELRNRIDASLGVGPSIVELLQGASVAELTRSLLPKLELESDDERQLAEILEELGGELGPLSEAGTQEALEGLLES